MSARKRLKASAPEKSLIHLQCSASVAMSPTSLWPTLLPELLQQASTYLLCSSATSVHSDAQLLCRLSAVCVAWHNAVYHKCNTGHVDFWSSVANVVVRFSEHEQRYHIGARGCATSVVPAALFSLRLVRALSLTVSDPPPLCGIAAMVNPLQHYSRLTSLNICLVHVASLEAASPMAAEVQLTLSAALTAFAGGSHNRLSSLGLHCPTSLLPSIDILRGLCTSVQLLSLSPNALLLMAWDTDTLYQRVWKTHSVQVFTVRCEVLAYLDSSLVIATLAASLPSLTSLLIEHDCEASSVNMLLKRLGSRLPFLHACTDSLFKLPAVIAWCTALVSLCIVDRHACQCNTEKITDMLKCLAQCPTLTELTVIACAQERWPVQPVYFHPIPQLRYLHIHMPRLLDSTRPELPWPTLTPNITHLALVLHASQVVSLLHSIDSQLLPQLTCIHVSCIHPASQSMEWSDARARLRARFGPVWCEQEEQVVRWRADRVWKRSNGLFDNADDYST